MRKCPDPNYATGQLSELTVCGTIATPPASQTLLRAADAATLNACFASYCAVGHMADSNLAGQTQAQISLVIPPGCRYAIAHLTRSGDIDSDLVAQADSLFGGTVAGIPATIVAASPLYGTERYLGTGAVLGASAIATTGSALVASPDPSRAAALTEAAAAAVTMMEVNTVAGFCVEVLVRTTDLEAL